ncbi:hypothetical protein KAX29_02710 [candidate division WOR-3 bacterium]|jgi:hypothetical protein|nr:hypothetical protein [candidate division WOR-3 bacterium]
MILNLLIGLGIFASSSMPQGETSIDTPSGISIECNHRYYIDYSLMASFYRGDNYQVGIYGVGVGKEFGLWNSLKIFPEVGFNVVERERSGVGERGFSPVFSVRFLYLLPSVSPRFQVGFTLKEIFDEEIGIDFLDIGIGFRL